MTCAQFPGNSHRFSRSAPRRGVTLIEILVVLAIIGVLVGITAPALRAARREADSALCLSTLRTMAEAFTLYAADHTDHSPVMPFLRDPDGIIRQDMFLDPWSARPSENFSTSVFALPSDHVRYWAWPLRTYITDESPTAPFRAEEAVSCPVVFREYSDADSGFAHPIYLGFLSYLHSPAFFTRPSAWSGDGEVSMNRDYESVLMSGVAHPSKKALLVERQSYHSGQRRFIYEAAPERFNVLAADGHVEVRRGDEAATPRIVEGDLAGGLPCPWCGAPVPYLTTTGGIDGVDW